MNYLLLILSLILVACTEPACPRCPEQDCPVIVLQPEPVASASYEVEVDVDTETAPEATASPNAWQPVDPTTLVGKWRAANGKPLPTFEIVANEQGSKTPMNFDIRASKPAHIGCGLYPATGTSFCKWVFDISDEPKAQSEELYALFVSKGDVISVELYDSSKGLLFAGEFVRDGAK